MTVDPSKGYEAVASAHIWRRRTIGAETVRAWARSLPLGTAVLDLGCGGGRPISMALIDEGCTVYGVDAAPSMVAAFRRRFPDAQVACEPAEESSFFGRSFDGIVAWGVMFLLSENAQREVIRRAASALNPGGRFLFTSGKASDKWADAVTGRLSVSLGADAYRSLLSGVNLGVIDEYVDEGENYYYDAVKR